MLEKIRVVFTIPELRNKILLTLFLLAIYRVGWQITLPMVDTAALEAQQTDNQDSTFARVFEQAAVFSASNLNQITIFGLGIMPYISASIIFQLLGTIHPYFEALQKEGESGRKKINEYTRLLTVGLCVVQSAMYLSSMLGVDGDGNSIVNSAFTGSDGVSLSWGWYIVGVMTMTCGTVFLMWLGEQIDEYGIGNGISLLIMAGILARMPGAGLLFFQNFELGLTNFDPSRAGIETLVLLVLIFVSVVAGVVYITQAQRKIPTQVAKHVRGRKVMGGTRQYLPLKINAAGVMPIIFASSLLMFPQIGFGFLGQQTGVDAFNEIASVFNGTSLIYNLTYVVLIYFFCFFWTAITFNPKDVADNLKNFGSFIPGYRPGRRTAEYLEKVMVRITYVGAGFLVLVAIIPTVITSLLNIEPAIASFYGGTGLLIAVSVAFDLVQKIDSHLVMRNYKGLLEA